MDTPQKLTEHELDKHIRSTQECRTNAKDVCCHGECGQGKVSCPRYRTAEPAKSIDPIDELPDLSNPWTLLVGAIVLVGTIGYCVLMSGGVQ
jgi:hypothetical protein